MRTALLVDGIWVLLAGIALLIPPIGAAVFAHPLKDPAVFSGWGAALIVIGVIALLAAQDIDRCGRLGLIFVGGLLLTAVDMIHFLAHGRLYGAYGAPAHHHQRRARYLDMDGQA